MSVDVPEADVHELSSRYHVHYEVRPYYVVWDQRPEGAPEVEQRVQAGFNVDLYAALETCQVPFFDTEDARMAVEYFNALGQKIQAAAGNNCTVETIPYQASLVLYAHEHFQPPEAMLHPDQPRSRPGPTGGTVRGSGAEGDPRSAARIGDQRIVRTQPALAP